MADITAVNYEELAQIVQTFGAQSEGIVQVQQRIKQAFDPLFSGDWQGEGGDAFFNEMNALVFPAIDRLSQALLHAQKATQHALDTMQSAEHDAQGLFQADGGAGGGNGGAGAAGAAVGAGAGAGAAVGASSAFMGSAGGAGGAASAFNEEVVPVQATGGAGGAAGGAGGAAGGAGTAQGGDDAGAAAPQAPAGPHEGIGGLSEQYETGGRGAGTVSSGRGDPGGPSYGSYQMTSQTNFVDTGGRVAEFLASDDGATYRTEFEGLTPGTAEFTTRWQEIATREPEAFQQAQHEFIQRTHYDVQLGVISDATGLDINSRSAALQDVVWSTSVQHGPSTSVVTRALEGQDVATMTDEQIINRIYDERGRVRADGTLARFTRVSPAVRQGVINRFRDERADALEMLNEGNAAANQ